MSINKDIFLHESDKAALDALESLPGFAQVTKAFIKAFNEKMLDVQNMSTNIRITDKQLKKYHDMLIPICKKLDIEVPDLYLTLNVMPNAYTSGDDKPCIVLTSGLLETMPEELIPTVLAHECGHIACHHVLYRTMGQMIFNGSLMLLMGGGLAALLTIPLRSAFAYWMRCSEFSADRAAILCDGSADKLVEMCMRFAGYDKRIADFADPKEFLNQAREYRDIIKDDSSRRSMEFALFRNNSHPNNALRALEADEWAKSEEFSRAKEYMDSLEAGISPRQFMASVNHDELVGKNVDEMKKKMEDLGFSVKLERKSEPNIFYGDNDITDATIDGKKDFKDFCEWLAQESGVESQFFTERYVRTADLSVGDRITLGWVPDRLVRVKYLGTGRFCVVTSTNSKLKEGDEFESDGFMLNFPLYITAIYRDGEVLPSYVAGRVHGLSVLEKA